MKRLFTFIILIILTFFINCVAFSEALAAEDTWYSQAAERAGNQVLLEEDQYYKGVSTDSRLISDLTYMEIPFQEYIDGTASDKIQIITFAEAFDKNSDGNIESKIVMYAYFPNSVGLEITKMWVFLDFESQKSLINDEFIDILSEEEKTWNYDSSWIVAEQYDNIVKFYNGEIGPSFSKRPVEKLFIKDNGNSNTEIHTIFNATIDAFEYYSPVMEKKYLIENEDDGSFYVTQNFQFIRRIDDEESRQTACVGYNYDTVHVEGEVRKYRYKTDILKEEHKFLEHITSTEYTDLYYFYFNVYDNESGDKWKDKVITKVTANYVTVKFEEYNTSTQFWGSTASVRDWTVNAEILGANGEVILSKELKPKTTADFVETAIENFISENVYDVKNHSTCVITPQKLKINYLNDSINNSWENILNPYYATIDSEYLTLFSTTSDEFKKIMNDSITGTETEILKEYQYGMIYGEPTGYINTYSPREWADITGVHVERHETYFHNELIGLVEIETVENGKVYKYSVTDTLVKNPGLIAPSAPGDDPWKDEEGPPKAKDDGIWAWLQAIIEFFTVTLPQWWEENFVIIIGVIVTIVAVIVTVFLVKLFKNWKTERMLNQVAQNQIQQNNQQQQQQQQQKPKRKRKRTNKKKE